MLKGSKRPYGNACVIPTVRAHCLSGKGACYAYDNRTHDFWNRKGQESVIEEDERRKREQEEELREGGY